MKRHTGTYRIIKSHGEEVHSFIPLPLPPIDPSFTTNSDISNLLTKAEVSLAKLSAASGMVPSTNWFLYGFVRKEAVISSQIEGTQATLRDVLAFEATNQTDHPDDVEEVCNYVNALTWAFEQLADPHGLPISTRLLCESHRILLQGTRGENKLPGEIRKTQNWIGGSRPGNAHFVPPPSEEVADALSALEQWIHSDDPLPPLIKAGLAHVQFETIHPFLDGNGRIGRLLIALLIKHWKLLDQPLLYLSLAFKNRQQEYYQHLETVRTEGDWEAWIIFFLECVCESADDGVRIAGELHGLINRDREHLINHERSTVAALRLLDNLPKHPIMTVPRASQLLGITAPPARKAIEMLVRLNILRETTGMKRRRVYAYYEYLRTLTGSDE